MTGAVALCTFRSAKSIALASFVVRDGTKPMLYSIFLILFFFWSVVHQIAINQQGSMLMLPIMSQEKKMKTMEGQVCVNVCE